MSAPHLTRRKLESILITPCQVFAFFHAETHDRRLREGGKGGVAEKDRGGGSLVESSRNKTPAGPPRPPFPTFPLIVKKRDFLIKIRVFMKKTVFSPNFRFFSTSTSLKRSVGPFFGGQKWDLKREHYTPPCRGVPPPGRYPDDYYRIGVPKQAALFAAYGGLVAVLLALTAANNKKLLGGSPWKH